jgi:hypothetical protein
MVTDARLGTGVGEALPRLYSYVGDRKGRDQARWNLGSTLVNYLIINELYGVFEGARKRL